MTTSTVLHGLVAMSNDEYHAGPGVSSSHLKPMARSPLHYWDRYINPDREPEKKSPALIQGAAFHCVVLEPDEFPKRYAAAPVCDRRTTEGKRIFAEFEAENLGKEILTGDMYANFMAMRDAVHRDPEIRQMLALGDNEQSFFTTDEETGELIKCRPDKIRCEHSLIFDLKSAEDASPAGFGRSAVNYGYHQSAPWYCDILEDLTGEEHNFAFIVVESTRPYAVMTYYVEPAIMAIGRSLNRRGLNRIAECRAKYGTNPWPGYSMEPEPLEIPEWYTRRAERILGVRV